MKSVFYLLMAVSVYSMVSCGSSSQEAAPKSPEELKLELILQESAEPLTYVSAEEVTMNRNLVREAGVFRDAEYDGWIMSGTIKNSATLAKFKDVVLTVQFLSATESVIQEVDHAIYEYFEPGSTKPFSVKLYPPDAMDKFHVQVKSALASE